MMAIEQPKMVKTYTFLIVENVQVNLDAVSGMENFLMKKITVDFLFRICDKGIVK